MADQLYLVQMTEHAEEALIFEAYSIAADLQAPESALNWAKKIQGAVLSLDRYPEKYRLTPEEPWHSLGLHRLPVGKYYIYYLIFKDIAEVRVTDIVFQGKNQAKHLKKMPLV